MTEIYVVVQTKLSNWTRELSLPYSGFSRKEADKVATDIKKAGGDASVLPAPWHGVGVQRGPKS